MDALAILAVRNDGPYIANCLRHLIREGLSVAVIDNDSTDDLPEILKRPGFRPHIAHVGRVPFNGAFELRTLWEAVDDLAARLRPDWVVYVDADEVLHSYSDGERVVDALEKADAEGFNVVNFDEFDFLPIDHDYVPDLDGWQPVLTYYFFQPWLLHQPRARRRDAGFLVADAGQHRVDSADARVAPTNLALRHYLFRSADHARSKYPTRRYSAEELARGFSWDRHGYPAEAFAFPNASRLKRLRFPEDRELDRSEPWPRHYWVPPPTLGKRAKRIARQAARKLRE